MKSMKKVLASVLALAMVVTAVPVTDANAASVLKLNKTKTSVYAGKATTVKVVTPSNWKSVKVTKVTSSKTSVAKAAKKSAKVVKITGVKAGKATVTIKVTGKKNGKKTNKTLKATVTVKPVVITAGDAQTLTIGQTAQNAFTVEPAGKKLNYKSDKPEVATVDANGVITAVAAGEATITASSKYADADATVKVTVKKLALQSVKQTKVDTIEAVVAGKTDDLKVTDFAIKNQLTKSDVLVKSVSVDKNDATKVTLTTYASMNGSADIDVTLDGITKSFKATDGKAASILVDPVTIPYSSATEIKAIVKDATGVELNSFNNSAAPAGYSFDIKTNDGYVSDGKLFLNKKGDVATAEVTYHTYKYENNQEVGTITSGKVTITAVDPVEVTAYALRIGDNGKKFDELKDGSQIALGETKYAAIQIKNANNKEISDYASYKVESGNKDVLVVSEGPLSNSNANIMLTPVKEGSAAIIVKKGDATVAALAVTVVAKREAKTLTFEKNNIEVSSKDTKDKTVKVTIKDQYGADYATSELKVELADSSKKSAAGSLVVAGSNNKSLVINGYGVKADSYVYKVTDKDGKAVNYFTVNVKDPSGADGYKIELNQTTIDTTVTGDNVATITGSAIEVSLAATKGGIVDSYVTPTKITFQKDGKDVDKKFVNGVKFTPVVTSGSSLVFADAGTYTVKAEYTYTPANATKPVTATFTASFTVENKQPAFKADRVKTTVDAQNVDDAVKEAYEFYYDGKKGAATYVTSDCVTNGKQIIVKSITLETKIGSTTTTITKKLDINQTITMK